MKFEQYLNLKYSKKTVILVAFLVHKTNYDQVFAQNLRISLLLTLNSELVYLSVKLDE